MMMTKDDEDNDDDDDDLPDGCDLTPDIRTDDSTADVRTTMCSRLVVHNLTNTSFFRWVAEQKHLHINSQPNNQSVNQSCVFK